MTRSDQRWRIFSCFCIFATFIAVAWYALAGCGSPSVDNQSWPLPHGCDVCKPTPPDAGPDAGNYW